MDNEISVRPATPLAFEEFGTAVALSGSVAIIGAYNSGFEPGAAYIFELDASGASERVRLTASDQSGLDHFGEAVAIDGDYAIVGASGANAKGKAYIFTRSGSSWSEQAALEPSQQTQFGFGRAVSISGNRVLVSASGAVYVFVRANGTWTQEARLTAPQGAGGAFGTSVALRGDWAIIGDPWANGTGQSGVAYVFQRSGNTWTLQSPALAPWNPEANNRFGQSVALSDDYAVVGAPNAISQSVAAGAVYVFERSGGFVPHSRLEPSAPFHEVKSFGEAVSISGEYLAVGDPTEHETVPGGGAAYVFRRNLSSWTLVTPKIVASDLGEAFDDFFTYFGRSVAISSSGVLVGAPGKTDVEREQGAAYLYPLPVELGDTLTRPLDFALFAEILFGVIEGGGGVIVTPGGPRPIDPPRPNRWERLSPSKRNLLMGMALTEIAAFIDDGEIRSRVKNAGEDLAKKATAKMSAARKTTTQTRRHK
jgi:hypothetical protein